MKHPPYPLQVSLEDREYNLQQLRYNDVRHWYLTREPYEIMYEVGEPHNLIDRAMCINYDHYNQRDGAEEPYKSGALQNARSWRTRSFRLGGSGGTLYKTGLEALKEAGEDRIIYDLYCRLVSPEQG